MPDRLAEIRARLDAATPGPWTNDDGWTVSSGPNRFYVTGHAVVPADAELIANAPADIAWLLTELAVRDSDADDIYDLRDQVNALWDIVHEQDITGVMEIYRERLDAQRAARRPS